MEVGHFFNPQSMDLNALYQQDIDLGVDWLSFEPVKHIKEVELQKQEPTLDLKNFIVDGETGEYLPIKPKETNEEQHRNCETGTSEFNIDECLDFLETRMSSVTNENISAASGSEQQSTGLSDLTALIQPEGGTTETINTGLWDDIATLSELTGLTFDPNSITNVGSPMSDNSAESDNIQTQFQNINQYKNETYNTQLQVQEPQTTMQKEQYYNVETQYHNFPTPPYADPSDSGTVFSQPENVTFPPDNNKPFGPADFEEAKMTELLMTEQNDLLVQLDNSNVIPRKSSSLNSEQLSSPGSWFFGGEEPIDNFTQIFTELNLLNNMQSQAGPYMNPSNAPYVPPPISGELETFANQGHVAILPQSYDSDSGISMEAGAVGVSQQMDIDMYDQDAGMDPHVMMPKNKKREQAGNEERSNVQTEENTNQRESRDMKRARELNITLSLDQIINSPVEEYNELLARTQFTPVQQSLIRDIRRRGKNKVAAQNCRKRKIETIASMETDIEGLNQKRQNLLNKQQEIERSKLNIKAKYTQLYQQIFHSLRDDSGRLYDQSRYSLEQVEGAIILVPGNHGNRLVDNRPESKRTVAFFDLSKVKIEKEE